MCSNVASSCQNCNEAFHILFCDAIHALPVHIIALKWKSNENCLRHDKKIFKNIRVKPFGLNRFLPGD